MCVCAHMTRHVPNVMVSMGLCVMEPPPLPHFLSVYFFSILLMPCLPGDMPQGTDIDQQSTNTDLPLHWEVQQQLEEIEAELAGIPPTPPSSPPLSPPIPQDEQETHEQQAFRLGRNIPTFLDRDLVDSFRPIYLVADFFISNRSPSSIRTKALLIYTNFYHRLPFTGSGGSSPIPLLFNTLSYNTEAALAQLLSQCNWNTSNKAFTTPISAASKAVLTQHLLTILNQITQQRSKGIVDEMMEQAGSDDPMTRGSTTLFWKQYFGFDL